MTQDKEIKYYLINLRSVNTQIVNFNFKNLSSEHFYKNQKIFCKNSYFDRILLSDTTPTKQRQTVI